MDREGIRYFVKYRVDSDKIFVKLSQGDLIIESLLSIATIEKLTSGWINGIGAVNFAELGFYDFHHQKYFKKQFSGDYEINNITANIAMKDGVPFIHAHITIGDMDFNVSGGHLFEGRISAAGEFVILPGSIPIDRIMDDHVGLALWSLGD